MSDYKALLDEISFDGKVVGMVESEGIDWGGSDPETMKFNAAQVRTGPVDEIPINMGTDELKFQMIEMSPANLKAVCGGTVGTVDLTEWSAPGTPFILKGPVVIKTADKTTITIANASLVGKIRGKLGKSGNLYADCKMTVIAPTDGSSPFKFAATPAV